MAIRRSLRVIRYLETHPTARFTDLHEHLKPLSRTALANLLKVLITEGEVVHTGRSYSLNPAATGAALPQGVYSLPEVLAEPVGKLLEEAANETMHSCALFGWVGASTMKILAEHNLPGWAFSPIGYEWPLVPFHGFAQLFLAYAPEILARDCFFRWYPYLQANERFDSYPEFAKRLQGIRKKGYAVEYRGELPDIMRIAVPIWLGGSEVPRYAVGINANAVYLLELDKCRKSLLRVAERLARVLDGAVPLFEFNYNAQIPVRHEENPLIRARSLVRARRQPAG